MFVQRIDSSLTRSSISGFIPDATNRVHRSWLPLNIGQLKPANNCNSTAQPTGVPGLLASIDYGDVIFMKYTVGSNNREIL
jgi:hypothetical protein